MPRLTALLFLLLAMTPAVADAPSCAATVLDLEEFLETLPRRCRKNSDCEGRYYRADSCAKAVVVRKSKLSPVQQKRLQAFQGRVREACESEWSSRPACSPQPYRAECRRNTCIDVLTGKEPGPPSIRRRNPAYPVATIRHACGPTDGPALQIKLSKVANPGTGDAALFLTLYADLPRAPLPEPHTYQLRPQTSGDGVRCLKPNQCETATQGELVLESFDGRGAKGSYKLRFKDGSVEEGAFTATWKEVPEHCG
ncbi:MAG: hypothetical protein ACRD24_07010 [Terriglobales bacterium]